MSNINDNATVSLFVNGEQAEAVMDRLRKKAAELDQQLKEAMDAGDKKKATKLQRELDRVNKELNRTESAAKGVGIVLNNLDNTPLHGLKNALKTLKKELDSTKPDTEEWHRYQSQIKQVQQRIDSLTSSLQENNKGNSWGFMGNIFDGVTRIWSTADLLIRGFGSAKEAMAEYVEAYADMEQEMAGVRKFTGMTEEQVNELNKAFKQMDTRTSREALNQLAQDAGRLGKTSVDDVLGFVRAADQINVALDDLGEGATLTLSKLTGIFGVENQYGTEKSLLKVGSVINELSQNCSASASYLTQFAERMGGVGAQAGMSIQQLMAFGAVLDSNSQPLEKSATAIQQVLGRMMTDPAKYAKAAGLAVEEFSKKIREDANGALIDFLEGLNKMGGMDNLAPLFKDLGETGSGAVATFSTLAAKIDEVKSQQEAANMAFAEGTSITNEYSVQNDTVAARLEKARTAAHELAVELGEKLQPLYLAMITSATALARALMTVVAFLVRHKAAVVGIAAAIAAYIVVIKSELIVKKARNAIDTIHYGLLVAQEKASKMLTLVTEGLRLAYYKVTGQTAKATVAQKAFSTAMAATPWGAILTAIVALVTTLATFGDELEDVGGASKGLADAEASAKRALEDERSQLRQNIDAIKNFNGSKEAEKILIGQLNEKYGSFFGTYKTLKEWYDTLTTSGDAYCQSIYNQMRMEAKRQVALDLIRQAEEKRNTPDYPGVWHQFVTWTNNMKFGDFSLDNAWNDAFTENKMKRNAEIEALESRGRKILTDIETEIANSPKLFNSTPSSTTPSTAPYTSKTLADKKAREEEKNARKVAALKRQEQAKAKAEFKQELASAKGDYEEATAINIIDYGAGVKSYEAYLAEKDRLDLEYLDRRIAIYESLYEGESETDKNLALMYDEEYQKFVEKRAELTTKQAAETAKRSISEAKREYDQEVAKAEMDFIDPNSEYYGNERAQAQRLHELKIDYLKKYRDAYKKNSKEWIEYERQLQEEEQDYSLARQQQLIQLFEQWRDKYSTQAARERYEMELGLIQELYEQNRISAEEESLWRSQLRDRYYEESKAAEEAATAAKYTVSGPGRKIDTRSSSDKAAARADSLGNDLYHAETELRLRFQAGLIDEDELNQGLKAIREAYENELFNPVRERLDEQTRMLFDLGVAWFDFFKGISETGKLSFEDLANVASVTFATMTAGLQTYSQFVEADKRIELAAVEKRYDKEIAAAKGNSKKVAQLEKKKEEEIAKVKAEYAKKEFAVKVVMAVAQTAQNALLGYAAGLQAGFPMATWLAPLLAGLAVAQGAIQIALIKKQQQAAEAEGYSQGGFTKKGGVNEPVGIVHAGEWVASQKLLSNPVARPMIEALDYAQRTNTIGSLQPDDVSRSITANNSLVRIAESDSGSALMAAVASEMARTVSDLTDRLNEPFYTVNSVTGPHGLKNALDEFDKLIKNKTPKSKRG